MKQVQDVIERLWDFIDKLNINTFGESCIAYVGCYLYSALYEKPRRYLYFFFFPSGKFLADNIVGSVVVFSLLFWIPLSILVHCVVGCESFL